jgi:hypothetical protein
MRQLPNRITSWDLAKSNSHQIKALADMFHMAENVYIFQSLANFQQPRVGKRTAPDCAKSSAMRATMRVAECVKSTTNRDADDYCRIVDKQLGKEEAEQGCDGVQ